MQGVVATLLKLVADAHAVFTQNTRSLPAEAGSVSWVEYLQDLHRAHSDELALVVCVVADVCRVNNQRLTRATYAILSDVFGGLHQSDSLRSDVG
jgi:hypothetical protein